MSIYVFLGPSLARTEAHRILDAHYLPPVAMGDVYRLAVHRAPRVIAIIDGVFERRPAVWHKEILFALERGIRVLGASSMGALRAAELRSFGMEGVGEIFSNYHTGIWEDEDEVAVAHGPAEVGYRPLSEAMANIRHGLSGARRLGLIREATETALVAAGKALYYADRSFEAVLQAAAEMAVPSAELSRLSAYLLRETPNLKRDDARALLRHVAATSEQAPTPVDFTLERTVYFERLTSWVGHAGASVGADATLDDVVRHVRMSTEREEVVGAALMRCVTDAEARRAGIAVEGADLDDALERLCVDEGVFSQDALDEWTARREVSDEELRLLARTRGAQEKLRERYQDALPRAICLELKRRGRLADLRDYVGARNAALRARGLSSPTLADVGLDLDGLIDWYQAHYRPILEPTLDAHASGLGFHSVRDFLAEILREYAGANPPGEKETRFACAQ